MIFAGKPYLETYPLLLIYFSGKTTLREVYIRNGTTTDSVFMIGKTLALVILIINKLNLRRFICGVLIRWYIIFQAGNVFQDLFIIFLYFGKPRIIISGREFMNEI